MNLYKIKCKKCGHSMNYMPLKPISKKSIKKCVYCGFSINIKNSLS
nr:hypothetical protein [uncultured archaeon]AQS34806.1 hypothetical protein [uncultured archaeon]